VDDARARYAAAEALANEPSAEAARRLVEMLTDDGSYELDDGIALFDRDPTTVCVYEAARDSLAKMPAIAWPAILAALPTATEGAAGRMFYVLDRLTGEQRAALPPEAHDAIVEQTRKRRPDMLAGATWERDFARRAHELPDAETFWRARTVHPNGAERVAAYRRLAQVVTDHAAFVRELVDLLIEHPSAMWLVVELFDQLPPSLPPADVRALAASELPREHPILLPVLARYGEPAAAIIPICLDLLQQRRLGDGVDWIANEGDRKRWLPASRALAQLGDVAAPVRAQLVERFLSIDETMSLHGSLMCFVMDALGGDRARLEAETADRVRALRTSANPVERRRAEGIQRLFDVSRSR